MASDTRQAGGAGSSADAAMPERSAGVESVERRRSSRRAWLLVPVLALTFGILGDLYSLSSAATYSASALLQIDPATVPPNESLDKVDEQEISTQLLVVDSEAIAATVVDELRLDRSVESVQRSVAVDRISGSRVLRITATWESPDGAASVANAFASQYLTFRTDQRDARLKRLSDEGDTGLRPGPAGTVLTPAVAKKIPSGPSPVLVVLLSALLGLLAGIALVFQRKRGAAQPDR